MNRVYLCIDLKTFYASVECVLRNLDPFKTDLIVADETRGDGTICLAISPKMKARGIKNRCRMWEIPENVKPIIAKPRMKKYIEYSAKVYRIYLKYISKEDIHPYSIDEMFLDVTSYLKLYKKTPYEFAKMMLEDIYDTLGLTATAGIGTNLYLAKIALDIIAKHNSDNIGFLNEKLYKEKLSKHTPLTDFWKIGIGIQNRLFKLNLNDMEDIARCNPKILYKEFGVNAKYLIDHANGIEPTTISDIKNYKTQNHSLSNSQILFKDYNYKDARIVLIEMIDSLVLDLIKKNLYTSTISFYIGYSKNITHGLKKSIKLEKITNNYSLILGIILKYYDFSIDKVIPIRKIAIRFNTVCKNYEQISLFDDTKENSNLEKTILDIRNKYGSNSLLKAISLSNNATQMVRNNLIGGHNAE